MASGADAAAAQRKNSARRTASGAHAHARAATRAKTHGLSRPSLRLEDRAQRREVEARERRLVGCGRVRARAARRARPPRARAAPARDALDAQRRAHPAVIGDLQRDPLRRRRARSASAASSAARRSLDLWPSAARRARAARPGSGARARPSRAWDRRRQPGGVLVAQALDLAVLVAQRTQRARRRPCTCAVVRSFGLALQVQRSCTRRAAAPRRKRTRHVDRERFEREPRVPAAGGVRARAHIKSRAEYDALYRRSIDDPEGFWAEQAEALHWFTPPKHVLEWKRAVREVVRRRQDQPRVQLPRPPPDERDAQQGRDHLGGRARRRARAHLPRSCTARSAAAPTRSRRSASRAGDRVGIYMGMVPEAAIAMLACARIGAVHSVVFGGFAADAVRDRMNDAQAKCVITQDGAFRRGAALAAQAAGRQGARAVPERRARDRAAARRQPDRDEARPRPRLARADERRVGQARGAPRSTPSTRCSSSIRRARPASPRACCTRPRGYMLGTYLTTKYVFDLQARGRLLVHGRRRLGHRPQLWETRATTARRAGAAGCLFNRPADRSDDFTNFTSKLGLTYSTHRRAHVYT